MDRESKTDLSPSSGSDGKLAVSGPVLARWLGISGKAVYELAKSGILVRVSRDQFLLEESVRRYCDHIRRSVLQPGTAKNGDSTPA
jgi:biotin operon repressor